MLIEPHGGVLVSRLLTTNAADRAREEARSLRQIPLREDLSIDVDNIATGIFSPLTGFMGEADYENVIYRKRLANGLVWTIPIVLDVDAATVEDVAPKSRVALMHPDGELQAIMTVREKFGYDRTEMAQQVFGTTDNTHPGW